MNAEFFHQFNQAFFQGDRQFIENNISEDIVWTMVGAESIVGKQAFLDAAFGMNEGYTGMDYSTELSLVENKGAALTGKMSRKGQDGTEKVYTYCDLYEVDDAKEGKIKTLITFVIELTE